MTGTSEPRTARCAYCGKEIWGFPGDWIHEDTGLGSAPNDEWCHLAPNNRHWEKKPSDQGKGP